MIEVVAVQNKKDLRAFVLFPFDLYRGHPYWVPPMIKEELETLDQESNPVFQNASAEYLLAYESGKVVGRMAVIMNRIEIEQQAKPKLRFGWFDVIDDVNVTQQLLAKAIEIGKAHNLDYIEGPVGFTNMEKAGILTMGFDRLNTMITNYNYPYYAAHFEQLGFEKQATWVEFKMDIHPKASDKVLKFSRLIKERYHLSVLKFKNKKEIMPYVDRMFELLNQTYSSLQTFVPIQPYQVAHYKEKYFPFIKPDYINCVQDQDGELIAFAIVMPSFSKALKKANGRLFPFGWLHILKAQYINDTAAFYLIGIHPDYQGKGVTSILFDEIQNLFNRKGIVVGESNPELKENTAVQRLWKDFNPVQHKERSTFRKLLQ
ncbi:MAG: GNAT family N-acetyltransferase [Flavobacteriaceae bacterium]|nr:GNAT family N-acetyltransferase [Flavobacteriaceae bacterium]MDG1963107.1 GNAT family N-acetyltransferase [Flavobacteriaceae bacterium]